MRDLMKKFNKLDLILFVIAVIAAAAAYLYLKAPSSPIGIEYNKNVYFTVELSYMQEDYADKVSVGDIIKDSTRGYYYGVVMDVSSEPTKRITSNLESGEYIKTEVPGNYTVYITVKCVGTESDFEIKAEEQVLRIGKRLTIKGVGYAGIGYVTSLWTEDIG